MSANPASAIKNLIKKGLEKTPYRVVHHRRLEGLATAHEPLTVSLVVACYNVAPYIERFLASVFAQTVMPETLQVILVNDGSTDQTGEIIDAWQARYPRFIRVVHQANGGVCAARNAGLALATATWVGFPDPDDFLDPDYFRHMIAEIRHPQKKPLLAVVSNLVFYFEDRDEFSDRHPLRYRFEKPVTRLDSGDLGKFIHLSGATIWLNRKALERHQLCFDENVRPTFEDAHLINRLIILTPERTVSFIAAAKYFYRKRSDQSSLVDRAKLDPSWYGGQIAYGYLNLLETSASIYGKAQTHIQRLCLYDLVWRFRHLVDHSVRADFLTSTEREEFLSLLEDAFSHIEAETISDFHLAGCSEEHKVSLLWLYKKARRAVTSVYVEQVDSTEGLVQFSYHTGGDDHFDLEMRVNGQEVGACFRSRRTADFLGRTYYRKHFFWLAVKDGDDVRFLRDGVACQIKRGGKVLGEDVDWLTLRNAVVPASPLAPDEETQRLRAHILARRDVYRGGLVLMDREDKADDNAEHLYRHLLAKGRAEKAWFVLSRDSVDWSRLEAEGFKLLPFMSDEHIAAQMNADFLLSSHIDQFILWPVPKSEFADLSRYKFIFLQHGVITNDLSLWLNSKPIRLFVTSMPREFEDISREDGNYVFSNREVLLSGLPRHDALCAKGKSEKSDSILIVPTWRKYLTDEKSGDGVRRGKVETFFESEYAQNWLEFLRSPRLEAIAKSKDLKIIFAPHPNISIYLDDMNLPKHIEVANMLEGGSYQDLFARAKLAVTCFSSAATEVAFLQRPVVYFQFDAETVFAGGHVYRRGYFSFEDNGFGPVAHTAEDALEYVDRALRGEENPIYSKRRQEAFPFRDGKCCERVWDAICKIRGGAE